MTDDYIASGITVMLGGQIDGLAIKCDIKNSKTNHCGVQVMLTECETLLDSLLDRS